MANVKGKFLLIIYIYKVLHNYLLDIKTESLFALLPRVVAGYLDRYINTKHLPARVHGEEFNTCESTWRGVQWQALHSAIYLIRQAARAPAQLNGTEVFGSRSRAEPPQRPMAGVGKLPGRVLATASKQLNTRHAQPEWPGIYREWQFQQQFNSQIAAGVPLANRK